MPGSAARIQVEIRCDPSHEERLRELLAQIDAVPGQDGRPVAVELASVAVVEDDAPLVVIGTDDETDMLAAVEEGAVGYLVASATPDEIEATLTTVAGGTAVIPPMMLGALLRHTVRRRRSAAAVEEQLEVLTDRERQVIDQLSRGRQRREIAQALFISPETVRTHIQRAMAKLGVHSQNELMALLAPLQEGRT